jgi:hypothetical protein
MYEFQSGDYIAFHRIVQPEQKCRFKTDYATGRPIAVPAIPEQVLPQAGDGQIIKLAKTKRKVRDLKTNEMHRYTVARVAAGSHLGVVTAILDDAELRAKPLVMDLGLSNESQDTGAKPGMYGTDARGGA